ncbi:MAG: hypothetical protein JOY71_10195 [Acetobacteraceae bacterium]|nr:hypothetical protein [Acetobacteraceae bacterium]
MATQPGPGPRSGLRGFEPAYFAMVMATGILSVDVHAHGYELFAKALFGVNALAYLVLWLINAVRLIKYPRAMAADLRSHARGPGFLTVVAGTSLIGSQIALFTTARSVAAGLWFFRSAYGC